MCPPTDPTDDDTPADTNFAKVAAEHLRDLKTYLQTQVGRIAALENAQQFGPTRVLGLKGGVYIDGNPNPRSALVNFQAREVIAKNAEGGTIIFAGMTGLTIDLAVGPGPVEGGRDQAGNFVVNDEIHIYAILDDEGLNPELIASLNATAPVLPDGYAYWCYLFSAVCMGTNLFPIMQVAGNRVWHTKGDDIRSGALNGVEWYNDKTELKIPNIAIRKYLDVYSAGDGAIGPFGIGDGDGTNTRFALDGAVNGITLFSWPSQIEIPKVGTHTSIFSGGIDALGVNVGGYTVPNGDV